MCPVHKHKCENYFKEIIRQQNMLKASMWQYTDSLNELTTSINRLRTNDGKVAHQEEEAPSFFTLFDFPVDKEEDLIRIDEYLHDEKNFNVAIKELSKIDGCSIYNFIQRALQMIISNNLATTYSWLGRRAKKAFNKLKLSDLIIGSVKRSSQIVLTKSAKKQYKNGLKEQRNVALIIKNMKIMLILLNIILIVNMRGYCGRTGTETVA